MSDLDSIGGVPVVMKELLAATGQSSLRISGLKLQADFLGGTSELL